MSFAIAKLVVWKMLEVKTVDAFGNGKETAIYKLVCAKEPAIVRCERAWLLVTSCGWGGIGNLWLQRTIARLSMVVPSALRLC